MRDVTAAADMVEVVSGRTQLRRASGSRFTGRCPFHEERTPSFSVNPVEKLYYCFGCGKGGDLISFVRETENLDFVGAIEWLAERFRVPLEYEESSPRVEADRRRRERLFAVLEQTTVYFERLLWEGDIGEPVRAYLAERGLGEGITREFRLGLSPGRGLAEKAAEKGFTTDELRGAGLATVRGERLLPATADVPARGRARARGRLPGAQDPRGTIRCAGSTSTRPRATSSTRARSCTGSTSRGRRSPSRTGPRWWRATRTSSRCGRRDSSRSSPPWGRR